MNALRIARLLHGLAAACVIMAGWQGGFGSWYWIGAVFFMGLLVFQHSLVKPTDLSRVNLAFFTTNGIASVLFAALVITDIIVSK